MEIDRLLQAALETPPFTRFYMCSIVILSASTSVGLLSPSSLLFIPSKAFSYQPWRLITSFLYFGDTSFNLLIHLYFIRRSVGQLENSYSTKLSYIPKSWLKRLNTEQQRQEMHESIEAKKSIDFFHFVGLMCAGIIVMVTFGFSYRKISIFRLGMILEDVMLFISCKNNPNLQLMFLLFEIRSAYFPYVYMFIQWGFSGEMNNDTRDFPVSFSLGMSTLMKSPYLWKFFICFTISHTWWYIHEVLMERIYNQSDKRDTAHREVVSKLRHNMGAKIFTYSYYEVFQMVLLSPPYWKYFWQQPHAQRNV